MCDPLSMGIAGTAMQIYSGNQAADANAKTAEQNARLSREQANAVEDKKARELTQINQQKQQTMGAQRAAMASNGVDSSYGSGLDALSNTAYLAQQDSNNTEINSANDKWGYQQQAANYDQQAGAARATGHNNAIGAILGGAGSVVAQTSGASAGKINSSSIKKPDNFFNVGYYGAKDAWSVSKVGKVNNKWYK